MSQRWPYAPSVATTVTIREERRCSVRPKRLGCLDSRKLLKPPILPKRHRTWAAVGILEEYGKIQAGGEEKQVTAYLTALIERFQVIERRLPVFSTKGASRKSRYYITDNYLLSWLGVIHRQIKSAKVRPLEECLTACSKRLETLEGISLEKLVRQVSEELSRAGDKDFRITHQVRGYWNRPEDHDKNIEIDQISVNDDAKWVRFGSCKRSAEDHLTDIHRFSSHIENFLKTKEGKALSKYEVRKAMFSPVFSLKQRLKLKSEGFETFGLDELTQRL